MKRLFVILSMITLMVGCKATNQLEQEYIKNLEEKNRLLKQEIEYSKEENRLLEQEIADLKDNSKKIESVSSRKLNENDYFTIGSTEKKVLELMGTPTRYDDYGRTKTMHYGLSRVRFENGKVISYNNFDKNLKVRVTE